MAIDPLDPGVVGVVVWPLRVYVVAYKWWESVVRRALYVIRLGIEKALLGKLDTEIRGEDTRR